MHGVHRHGLPRLTCYLALEDTGFFSSAWISDIYVSRAGWGGGGECVFYCNLFFYFEFYLV